MQKTIFPYYIHLLIYFVSAALFAFFLDVSMVDDGLRHLAFAANSDVMSSWGSVYPHSLFNNYDLWYVWHRILQILLYVFNLNDIHIVVNTFVFFSLLVITEKLLLQNTNYHYSSLIFVVTFSILFYSYTRYSYVRPDLLSGLYVMYALSLTKNRFLPLFILTLIYSPTYYLFFLYTGSIGLVTLAQRRYKALLGVFTGSLLGGMLFLLQDSENYLKFVTYILSDQSLRQGLSVNEGQPLFEFLSLFNYYILVSIFLSSSIFLSYRFYHYFQKNSIALFLLFTSILWVNQVRYIQLFDPLFAIFFISTLININKKNVVYQFRKFYIIAIRSLSQAKIQKLFYYIAIPYVIAFGTINFHNNSQNKKFKDYDYFTNSEFNNSTVMLSTMPLDIYYASYINPSIKMVPSCAIGWFDDSNQSMKDLYIKMIKSDQNITPTELHTLLKYVRPNYYLYFPSKENYSFDELRQIGLKPKRVINEKILFEFTPELQ